jgi:ubiquinone/menaquinone biosynthesis C-methylase UbiE
MMAPEDGSRQQRGGRGERERLRTVYLSEKFRSRHRSADVGNQYLASARWDAFLTAVRRSLDPSMSGGAYLEVGSGVGVGLERVSATGIGFRSVAGVDFLLEHLQEGKTVHPGMHMVCADGLLMPFAAASFDVVTQIMMLSSVLDPQARCSIGAEMLRVLKPGGVLISFDLRYPQLPPRHRIALGLRGLREVFPRLSMRSSTNTLLPPLARLLAPRSIGLCRLLEKIPFLRAFRVAVIRKPGPEIH